MKEGVSVNVLISFYCPGRENSTSGWVWYLRMIELVASKVCDSYR